MDKFLVIIGALVAIGFILWWFFGKRAQTEVAANIEGSKQSVVVKVSGGYSPNIVTLKQGVPAKVIFERKDPSACFEEVMFPDFGIKETLPVNKPYEINIDTSKPGTYTYACGMNMFHGKVVIK